MVRRRSRIAVHPAERSVASEGFLAAAGGTEGECIAAQSIERLQRIIEGRDLDDGDPGAGPGSPPMTPGSTSSSADVWLHMAHFARAMK